MFCSRKIVQLVFFFCSLQTSFAQSCDNVGFENGTTGGWICTSGTFGVIDSAACDISLPIFLTNDACMDQGGVNGDLYPVFPRENRHTLLSDKTGTDPNSLNTVNYVAPDTLFPSGVNRYSFRLGNGVGTDGSALALAESIKFPFTVTAQNSGLTYLYSAFLREALPAVHALKQAPRFEVKITEKKNGGDSLIKCGYYLVVAGATSNFLKGASDFTGSWKYTNWTKVALDLTEYIGKQLTIEFRTADCFPGSGQGKCRFKPGPHSAYAYIDLYCAPVSIISPPLCDNQASVQLCAPPGYATYQWPANQPGIVPPLDKQCVTINNPKAGNSYQVQMTSVTGCLSSTSTALNRIKLNIKDTVVCKSSPPFHLNAIPTVAGNYTFKWMPSTYLSCMDCQNPLFTPGTTTTYTITLSDKNNPNCIIEKIMTVHVDETPLAAFTFKPNPVSIYDPTVQFIDQSSTDVIFWKWDMGDSTTVFTGIKNPVHKYPIGTSGIYKVKLVVKNQRGCMDSVQHPVEVGPEFVFYIPNAFTPISDDGKNDTFFGKGAGIAKYHIWIFDRWGNMVFYTEDIHTGWNGRVRNNSDIAPQDVYVWKVHLTDVSGREHQYIGTVTLLK